MNGDQPLSFYYNPYYAAMPDPETLMNQPRADPIISDFAPNLEQPTVAFPPPPLFHQSPLNSSKNSSPAASPISDMSLGTVTLPSHQVDDLPQTRSRGQIPPPPISTSSNPSSPLAQPQNTTVNSPSSSAAAAAAAKEREKDQIKPQIPKPSSMYRSLPVNGEVNHGKRQHELQLNFKVKITNKSTQKPVKLDPQKLQDKININEDMEMEERYKYFEQATVSELKEILRSKGLPAAGKKPALLERLMTPASKQRITPLNISDSPGSSPSNSPRVKNSNNSSPRFSPYPSGNSSPRFSSSQETLSPRLISQMSINSPRYDSDYDDADSPREVQSPVLNPSFRGSTGLQSPPLSSAVTELGINNVVIASNANPSQLVSDPISYDGFDSNSGSTSPTAVVGSNTPASVISLANSTQFSGIKSNSPSDFVTNLPDLQTLYGQMGMPSAATQNAYNNLTLLKLIQAQQSQSQGGSAPLTPTTPTQASNAIPHSLQQQQQQQQQQTLLADPSASLTMSPTTGHYPYSAPSSNNPTSSPHLELYTTFLDPMAFQNQGGGMQTGFSPNSTSVESPNDKISVLSQSQLFNYAEMGNYSNLGLLPDLGDSQSLHQLNNPISTNNSHIQNPGGNFDDRGMSPQMANLVQLMQLNQRNMSMNQDGQLQFTVKEEDLTHYYGLQNVNIRDLQQSHQSLQQLQQQQQQQQQPFDYSSYLLVKKEQPDFRISSHEMYTNFPSSAENYDPNSN